jgi:hypothetical protein
MSTDHDGRAERRDLLAGPVTVQARHIGFKPGLVLATVAPGTDTLPIVLSDVEVPRLDTVRIVAARALPARHSAFETRSAQHVASAAFSRADIQKRNPTNIWQLLSNVPSLKVTQTGSLVTLESSRGQVLRNSAGVACAVLVIVDDVVLNTDGKSVNANDLPRPSEIYGVEVFSGSATIPPQYVHAAAGRVCGLVAIWTR